MTRFCAIDHASRVAEVRRTALAMARAEGLNDTLADNLALIVTEVCTNLLKHAQGGEVCLSPLSDRNGAGVEVLAIDRGPGIVDVERCLTDGYSSAHTAGTGLGAVSRLARDFDVYSEPGKGTVLVAQVGAVSVAQTLVGAVVKPIKGEDVSGDAWACRELDGELTMMVADGLGHGVLAAEAAAQAVAAFRLASDLSPEALLEKVHQALRKTRGAAVAVTQWNQQRKNEVRFAGIGNIGAVLSASGRAQFMVSHAGTAGYGIPRIQVFSYSPSEGTLLVMHSDGLTSSWNVDDHIGLRKHHPSLIAGILYRDASRNRDDLCVVVAKARSSI